MEAWVSASRAVYCTSYTRSRLTRVPIGCSASCCRRNSSPSSCNRPRIAWSSPWARLERVRSTEVIRRISGRKLGQFFADEVAGPLGIDFHIGLDPTEFHRVSNVIPPPPLPIDFATLDMDSVLVKTFTGPAPSADVAWTPEWRQADIGAANGHGNARSVARAQAVVACGGTLDGVQLLSPATVQQIFRVQADGVDQVLGIPSRFGIGYGLPNESYPYFPSGQICFWGGWGGSVIIVDVERRMTIAYMMNRMESGLVGDARGENLVRAAYAAIGVAPGG